MRKCIWVLLLVSLSISAAAQSSTAAFHKTALDYYRWRDQQYPVNSSDQGLHTWDDRLTDYSIAAIAARQQHVEAVLKQINALQTASWSKDDRIDWYLFRSQLERDAFPERVLKVSQSDPEIYVNECSNAIFSLLKKDYAPSQDRARSATARLKQMPAMLQQGKRNLTTPVRLYSTLATESARSIDPLFNDSLMTLATNLSPAEREQLISARDAALKAIHAFADGLERDLPKMRPWAPMGEANYNYYLHRVYLLPINADQVAMLGRVELARYRALEALLPDPSLADPNPARSASIPANQEEFLKAYEDREAGMIGFLKSKQLVTFPPYLGHFYIRQLPEAFKPTSPGGFMNPPGIYDKNPDGFYFLPTYNPKSGNFYIRAAIEEPRPILGHEGIPGHFLQLSISNHLSDEIRRQQEDGIFTEGWALYTEEMLMRTGLYAENSPAQGQVLHLSRYRAARVLVDVNLHTGKWTFDEAVKFFMEAGGLDHEAAEGEAAGAASSPTQKITYMVGKWQIMDLLGKYRDHQGANFRLGQFHDDLLKNGTLPVSIQQWILLDDDSAVKRAAESLTPRLAKN